jgi:sarcosine oxidase
MRIAKTCDAAVVGAGVFGAWTAWHLARAGKKVVLLDAYGPANARASSAGESRIMRAGYGPDALYTRWAVRSLGLWKEFFTRTGADLFCNCGMLWLARERDIYVKQTAETLASLGVPCERLERGELRRRFPQCNFAGVDWGLFEPGSGALLARRAVQAVVADAVRSGAEYLQAEVKTPASKGKLKAIETRSGEKLFADAFVFACGPWLGKVFPSVLGRRIFPSRQEVFFFGVPGGDVRFSPPAMPAWIYLGEEVYGLPDLENRGFKIALDRHGKRADPDTESRVVSPEMTKWARRYVARRFPALRKAPIVETRVCQYENTSNGDFLIDRHPEMENVWLAGGGSGHGFKHGPALGEYVAGRLAGSAAEEPRFSLATKRTAQKRIVY